jgi:hypothetical protein
MNDGTRGSITDSTKAPRLDFWKQYDFSSFYTKLNSVAFTPQANGHY